jgi:hypothetical protein
MHLLARVFLQRIEMPRGIDLIPEKVCSLTGVD